MSHDQNLFRNTNSIKWSNKEEPKKEKITKGYYFTGGNVVENLIDNIRQKGVNISEDYDNYLKIGFGIADEFGESGRDYFHAISQHSTKYDYNDADKQYTYILKSEGRGITIATLFYYAKEAGIDIYTDKQKDIINQVTNAKNSGMIRPKQIAEQIAELRNEQLTAVEEQMVEQIFNDKADYSKSANEELSEIEILENFIIENYEPKINDLTKLIEIKGRVITDGDYNRIYIDCKKRFDFNVTKTDVNSIIESNSLEVYSPIKDFFSKTPDEKLTGYIDAFIECVETENPEFAKKFFKKWLISGVHNWTRPDYNNQVSPLTLVLCGSKHGTGKTSFFRAILPKELSGFYVESKLKGDNDSLLLMNSSLILLDDEFGGKAFKENKAFKELSDKNIITIRRPYKRVSEDFKRITLLAGTTNEVEVLKDPTGNRRIIPINVKSIDLEKAQKIDTSFMLWEAYQELKNGFEWVVRTQEEMDEILQNSSVNIEESAEVEVISQFFSSENGGNWTQKVINKAEMLHFLAEKAPYYQWNKHSFKDWSLKNKLEYKTHRCPFLKKAKKGYKIFQNPMNEIPIPKTARPDEKDDLPW